MRIKDLLTTKGISLNAAPATQGETLERLVELQKACGNLNDPAGYKKALLAREGQSSTAIGNGIAVPHAKTDAVKRPGLAAMTVPKGVDYGAPDGKPSTLFFAIAAPANGGDTHLEILARLMTLLMDGDLREKLLAARTPEEFLAVLDRFEGERYPEEAAPSSDKGSNTQGFRVLAVTACPTGIAHTYMAAEALEKAGKAMGVPVKAETQGSGGAKNVLTPVEIANCDGIIIAADKNVDLSRFHGKPLLRVPVSDGIGKAEELIRRVTGGGLPVYQHQGGTVAETLGSEGFGRQLYKHLMNGVSHMLPFVVAGGILIALAFLLDDPELGYETFGTNTPLAAWFKNMGGAAFNFMLPILAGYIALSIADRPGLMVGFVGGTLAASGATFANPAAVDAIPAGFLGALIAGFVGGYLVLILRRLCDRLPDALEGLKPVLIYPLAGLLLICVVMCAINPFMALLNTAISDTLTAMGGVSAVLLGAVVAGMMAIDMGGPFNKAAYAFGIASITMAADSFSPVMAAVMVGGMVPPIAIALTCTFFRNRFSDQDRKSGYINYIMGLCFITEGAIPFAAADPLRVIPACVAGSAVAGGLSMLFGCALPAPHGGIFVFPVMENALMYTAALAIGSVLGMLLLAVLKKKRESI